MRKRKKTAYIQPKDDASEHHMVSPPEEQSTLIPNSLLIEIFEGGKDCNPFAEIENIFTALSPSSSPTFIRQTHNDLTAIFSGKYPGFKAGPTKYHDLRHTRNVALATIRLFHGLACEGISLPPDILQLGLVSAYFHDTGMLLTDQDTAATGATYLKCHEKRSITFLQQYLKSHGFSKEHIDSTPAIINCTNLTLDPATLTFPSTDIQIAGEVLGTADIMAQMADRYYLECLPLLYFEQQDAGIDHYASSMELMRQTTKFYHEVIEKRLQVIFNNTGRVMQTHFREWWQLDRNIYMDFITKNIKYLEQVIANCDTEQACREQYLRRKQPKIPL